MTHPSKRKGNVWEREIVQLANDSGIPAERAYASNGRALGHHEEVDCLIGGKRVQAKRRRSLPAYLCPTENVDAVVFRRDFGEALVLITYSEWLDLISGGTD